MLLVHVKRYYKEVTGEELSTEQYDQIEISPVHIHKNKIFHKKAILTIGEEIVRGLRNQSMPVMEYVPEPKREKVAVEQ
jgi:hypothetical protein